MNGVVARRDNFNEPILGFLEDAFEEWGELTGRRYGLVDEYKCDDAETVYAALGAGASGYLLKSASPDELLAAVAEARAGGMLMQRQVARLVLAAFEARRPAPDYGLTPRETEVLSEMVAGHTQPQIAERLFVSLSTVNSHVQNVYAKLHVHNGSAAVAKAVRERLVGD